jgi:DNA (cytosine-5)-methyltransferase 1
VAADFGAPTTRRRLVLVARRHNVPVVWPRATHSRSGRGGLKKWLPASSIIDWSIEVPSIFDRKKPLVEKSVDRIIKGLQKFVFTDPNPYLAPAEASTVNHADLIVPWIMKRYGGMVGNSIELPFPTIMVQGTQNVLACAKLKRAPADGTITAAFLAEYYSEGGQHADLRAPFPTIPTKDRFSLVTVTIRGTDYVITDIGYRMLTPRELARAQGFPEDYVLTGNKHAQVARIGNSVCPAMAEAVVRALLASPPSKRKAA